MLAGLYMWLLRRRRAACRRCPHDRDSHPSCIPGGTRPAWCTAETGAGTCRCHQYKPERPWTLAMAFLRERPPPVTADVLRPRPVRLPVPDPVEYDDKTEFGIRVPPYAGPARTRRERL